MRPRDRRSSSSSGSRRRRKAGEGVGETGFFSEFSDARSRRCYLGRFSADLVVCMYTGERRRRKKYRGRKNVETEKRFFYTTGVYNAGVSCARVNK